MFIFFKLNCGRIGLLDALKTMLKNNVLYVVGDNKLVHYTPITNHTECQSFYFIIMQGEKAYSNPYFVHFRAFAQLFPV